MDNSVFYKVKDWREIQDRQKLSFTVKQFRKNITLLNVKDFAKKIGVHPQYLKQIESEKKLVSVTLIRKIIQAFDNIRFEFVFKKKSKLQLKVLTVLESEKELEGFIESNICVRDFRMNKKYKQYEFAKLLNLSRTFLTETESGKHKVSLHFLQTLSDEFNDKISLLFYKGKELIKVNYAKNKKS